MLSNEKCFFEQFACGCRENFQFINYYIYHILYLNLSYLKNKKDSKNEKYSIKMLLEFIKMKHKYFILIHWKLNHFYGKWMIANWEYNAM